MGVGGEAQTDRQTETDGQRARDMKSYRSGTREEESSRLGKGKRERENIPTFPFLSVPLTTLGWSPQKRRGPRVPEAWAWEWVWRHPPCLGPQGAGRVGEQA